MRVTQLLRRVGAAARGRAAVTVWASGRTTATSGCASAASSSAWTAGSRAAGCASRTRSRGAKAARYRGLQHDAASSRYSRRVRELNRLGWRVFTHAVGDAAIDQVLAGYEAANAEKPIAGRRWGIEHAFIARPDQFPRMEALGLGISAQNHLYLAGPDPREVLGPERGRLDDAGARVSRCGPADERRHRFRRRPLSAARRHLSLRDAPNAQRRA